MQNVSFYAIFHNNMALLKSAHDRYASTSCQSKQECTSKFNLLWSILSDVTKWYLTLIIISGEIQEALQNVNWTKLMQILEVTGSDWHERRLTSKLYMDQSVKLKLGQGEMREWRLEEELEKDAVCCWFHSTCTATTLPRKLLKALETSK